MYLPVAHVQAEIDIANLKLASVLKRYPDRQLHGINRSARQRTIQRWIEWEQHSCFGQMTIIQSDSFFTKVMLSTVQRLASHLKASIPPSEEEALAYPRQQQRQSVDESAFFQWW